jgi:hypothetical protein
MKLTVMKPGFSECRFLCPECAKTRLRAYMTQKILDSLPLAIRVRDKREGEGRGKEEEGNSCSPNFQNLPSSLPFDKLTDKS